MYGALRGRSNPLTPVEHCEGRLQNSNACRVPCSPDVNIMHVSLQFESIFAPFDEMQGDMYGGAPFGITFTTVSY